MKEQWLEQGYAHFAKAGPENLSINQIGREIGASRSSFYHHFGDIPFFIDELLAVHWETCQVFNLEAARNCRQLFPELYQLLASYPLALQFHLQLFRRRNIPSFNYIFIKSYEQGARAFALKLFADHLQWKMDKKELYHLWMALGEAWYSRLDPDNLSAESLQDQAKEVLKAIAFFKESGLFPRLK